MANAYPKFTVDGMDLDLTLLSETEAYTMLWLVMKALGFDAAALFDDFIDELLSYAPGEARAHLPEIARRVIARTPRRETKGTFSDGKANGDRPH